VSFTFRSDDNAALPEAAAHQRRQRHTHETTDRAQLQHLGLFVDARRANPPGVVWVRCERPLPMSD
jgi:hypothetical protein